MLSAFQLMPLRRPACDRHIFLPANNSVQRSQQLHFLFAATFFLLFLKIFFCLTGMMELLPKKFLRFINFLLFLTRPQDASFFACCAAILPESHIIPDIPVCLGQWKHSAPDRRKYDALPRKTIGHLPATRRKPDPRGKNANGNAP